MAESYSIAHTHHFFINICYCLLLLHLSPFHPFILFCPAHPLPPAFPHLCSCPWVVHISSLASPLSILFLTSPCLFSPYHLAFYSLYLFPHSPFPFTADNPPCDLHFCGSVPVLVVCLVHFCFCFLGSVVDSCEFVVILLFTFLIFFLDKSWLGDDELL